MTRTPTRALVSMALLAALQVVLARLLLPMPNVTTRYSIEAVPIIIAGYLFGPPGGAAVGFVGDLVGTIFSGYGYNPVFALPPVLIGICAGLLRSMVINRAGFFRVLATFLPAMALGSVLWQSWWLAFFYGSRSFVAFLGTRSIQFAITSIVDAAIVMALLRSRVFETLRLWPPHTKHDMKSDDEGRDAQ